MRIALKWTAQEDRTLEKNCGHGYPHVMANLPSRTMRAIRERARIKGLIVDPKYSAEARAHMAELGRRSAAARTNKDTGIKWLCDHSRHDGDDCLIWPFGRDTSGYGILSVKRLTRKASIVMCEMAHGPKPTPAHKAAFSCARGNCCIHPGHLSWKTMQEIHDAARVRRTIGRAVGARDVTEADVAAMKQLVGKLPYTEIGAQFGIKHKQVGRIVREEHWKGGKRGHKGFPPGDPRNIGWIKAHATMRLRYPPRPKLTWQPSLSYRLGLADENYAYCAGLVPPWAFDRDNVIQSMWLALFEGRVTRAQLNWRDFSRQACRMDFEPLRARFRTPEGEAFAIERMAFEHQPDDAPDREWA